MYKNRSAQPSEQAGRMSVMSVSACRSPRRTTVIRSCHTNSLADRRSVLTLSTSNLLIWPASCATMRSSRQRRHSFTCRLASTHCQSLEVRETILFSKDFCQSLFLSFVVCVARTGFTVPLNGCSHFSNLPCCSTIRLHAEIGQLFRQLQWRRQQTRSSQSDLLHQQGAQSRWDAARLARYPDTLPQRSRPRSRLAYLEASLASNASHAHTTAAAADRLTRTPPPRQPVVRLTFKRASS